MTSVRVGGEDEFTTAVCLHPADINESADTLSGARKHVGGVQCIHSAVNKLAIGMSGRNPHRATALNVNADSSHARGSGERCELCEVIISEGGDVYRAGGINDLEL
jgi:hypothetical protein